MGSGSRSQLHSAGQSLYGTKQGEPTHQGQQSQSQQAVQYSPPSPHGLPIVDPQRSQPRSAIGGPFLSG